MEVLSTRQMRKKSNEIREDVIKMLVVAGSGHSAGSLGQVEMWVSLYFNIMNYDPKKPEWGERDRLFLSCGHVAPVMYATLAHAGYFKRDELKSLRKLGSRLQGHPERERLPGVESTSGPLGSGLAQAAGYAYAARMDGEGFRVYCITSDGEHDEGNHWEAVMFAGKYKLPNLTVFVDRNNIQIDGFTEDVMPLEPLREKYESFGWHVLEINGNSHKEIIEAVRRAKETYEKPSVIIANTVPGKGVSFMENRPEWHGKVLSKEEAKEALGELKAR